MQDFMAITKALADANRVRMLLALDGRELCVCQIIELMGLAPSTVSKDMSILRQAGLVEGCKEGRWMYYRLAGHRAPAPVRKAIRWMLDCLAGDAQIMDDARRLQAVIEVDPETICRRQSARICQAD